MRQALSQLSSMQPNGIRHLILNGISANDSPPPVKEPEIPTGPSTIFLDFPMFYDLGAPVA